MPRQPTTRKSQQKRVNPYHLRGTPTTTSSGMAVGVASPMVVATGWEHMPTQLYQHVPPQTWTTQHQSPYAPYQHQLMASGSYHTVPSTQSMAPAVQTARHVPRHSGSSSNVSGSGPWTAEMDELLIDNHKRLKWDQIAEKLFNNAKTGNACRKRFARVLAERKEPARWDQQRVLRVVDAYNRPGMRENVWKPLAVTTGEKWEDIERLCFGQGYRTMVKKASTGYNSRRHSQTASSHRSNASNTSDYSRAEYNDEGVRDDSGLGDDIHDAQHVNMPDTNFQPHTTTYHGRLDDEDGYYRY